MAARQPEDPAQPVQGGSDPGEPRGADLRRTNLGKADLSHADLRGAQMSGADLQGAALRGAELIRADLRRADLRGADLFGANLRGADVSYANLSRADLDYANLRGTGLSKSGLTQSPVVWARRGPRSSRDKRWMQAGWLDENVYRITRTSGAACQMSWAERRRPAWASALLSGAVERGSSRRGSPRDGCSRLKASLGSARREIARQLRGVDDGLEDLRDRFGDPRCSGLSGCPGL